MARDNEEQPESQPPGPPQILLDQAHAAAEAQDQEDSQTHGDHHAAGSHHGHHLYGSAPHIEHVPPPPYNGAKYGQLDISQNGMDTDAKVGKDGRINININQRSCKLSNLLVPALRRQLDLQGAKAKEEPPIPEGLGETRDGLPPPPMNLVIQIVGSRGDVQPFIALGQVLKNKYGHRVRVATHPVFRDFVTDNGLEFFSIGGDPAELMAFMVKNPGLMPGMDSLKSGDIGKRRKGIYEMVTGCWRSCIEAGDGTGIQASDDLVDSRSFDSRMTLSDPTAKPFVADAIIANPPSFAHVHIAEKLGIPLHLMFTMPWSPTQSFPHPLANIVSSNTDANMANFMTYALVDMLTWQGLGDVINRFRQRSLGLEPISIMWAPGMTSRLRIPWTYCWSPALIPKPADWGNYIDISGFYFLNLATNFTPPPDLAAFLEAGPPPVYIGFGSIVVDNPNAMTKMIFDAVKKTGQRALISKGWGGLGADELGIPENCFMLGNIPHDWLFKHVSCVVHHGGAGTTAAGIAAGRPTVVVPFFGDQPFWGAMCARAGAGPMPIAYKELNADKLASQIMKALEPASLTRAKELSDKIKAEDGSAAGAESFHKQLNVPNLRCSLCPDRVAVWRVRRTDIRLSALAATVLGSEGLIDFNDLKLYRAREYETEDGPWEPITGGAAALIGTIGNFSMGIADLPVEILKSLKTASHDVKEGHEKHRRSQSGASTPTTGSNPAASTSTSELTKVGSNQSDGSRLKTSSSSPTNALTPVSTPPMTPPLSTTQTVPDEEARVGRRTSAMASVMSADGESRHHRRWSRGGSRSRSRDPKHKEEENRPMEDLEYITLESAISGAKAAGRIASAGIKSPMDFTLSIAQGFHNAPKLYGDSTVRKQEKITDFQSGIKAASKEFGYGFYDGITGLVTQPIAGARKEGGAGFIKGFAKGVGGLILKPGAGIWGIPGYTAKGVYAEISKHFGSSVQNYIIAARTSQGYDEWKESGPELRADIVAAWKSTNLELRKGGRKYGTERKNEIEEHILTHTPSNNTELLKGFKNTRHLTWDERKALSARKDELRKQQKETDKLEQERKRLLRKESRSSKKSRCRFCPFDHDSDHHLRHASTLPVMSEPSTTGEGPPQQKVSDEFEEAIQASVAATSRGDPQEDIMIERALRASVNELKRSKTEGSNDHEDEAYDRAVKASINEAKLARAEHMQQQSGTQSGPAVDNDEHDQELHRVLTKSLEEYKSGQVTHHVETRWDDSEADTEDDEEFKKTLEESKRLHTEQEQQRQAQPTSEGTNTQSSGAAASSQPPAAASTANGGSDDEDLQRAMTASAQESKTKDEELARQRTEEEIVLEYVKKQSLLEEELRQKRQQSAA
jgi:UDP:flavonoid glycosyltransferase YjiC (YdhE family)